MEDGEEESEGRSRNSPVPDAAYDLSLHPIFCLPPSAEESRTTS